MLTGVKLASDKANAQIQKAKDLGAQQQRCLTRAGEFVLDVGHKALQLGEVWGIEDEAKAMERLRVFSMSHDEVKTELKELFHHVKRTGSRAQLRWRLLNALRNETLPDVPDEEDTATSIEEDEEQRKKCRMEFLKKEQERMRLEMKALGGGKKDSKDAMQQGLPLEKMLEIYAEERKNMHRKMESFSKGDMVVAMYGDVGGNKGEERQGRTPGMPRALKILQPKVEGMTHLTLCERMENAGNMQKQDVRNYFVEELDRHGVARLTKTEWGKLKTIFKCELADPTASKATLELTSSGEGDQAVLEAFAGTTGASGSSASASERAKQALDDFTDVSSMKSSSKNTSTSTAATSADAADARAARPNRQGGKRKGKKQGPGKRRKT